MADLAIIVRSSYYRLIDTCSNQKVYEKINFSGFAVKAAESHFAWFCSLLHMFWAADKAQ